jgi:hypothetical protein
MRWGGSADIICPGQLTRERPVFVYAFPITDLAGR